MKGGKKGRKAEGRNKERKVGLKEKKEGRKDGRVDGRNEERKKGWKGGR